VTPLDRLLSFVHPEPNTGCWLFCGCTTKKGYGKFFYKGRSQWAHIVSYKLHGGKIRKGRLLDHRCDTRPCINPEHLKPTSQRKNTARGMSPSGVNGRKVTCVRGHDLMKAPKTTRGDGRKFRRCLECEKERRHGKTRTSFSIGIRR
jgi:hypothetical protein